MGFLREVFKGVLVRLIVLLLVYGLAQAGAFLALGEADDDDQKGGAGGQCLETQHVL